MMKYEQGAIHLDLLYLRLGQGCGNHSLAVGFATDIANMSLDHFAIDAAILYFCKIDFVTTFNSANKAHSVHIVHYDKRKTSTFLGSSSGRINRLHQGFKRTGAKCRWRSVQKRGRIQAIIDV